MSLSLTAQDLFLNPISIEATVNAMPSNTANTAKVIGHQTWSSLFVMNTATNMPTKMINTILQLKYSTFL